MCNPRSKMRFSFILLLGSVIGPFVGAAAVEAPVITPAPISPIHEALRQRQAEREVIQDLLRRQSSDGDDFCYGVIGNENGICSFFNTLAGDCDQFETSGDYTAFWKCQCGNGAVSAQQQCDWCQDAFGIGLGINVSFAESEATSACISVSASIAPVPASLLSLASSFNASFTGTLPPSNSGTGSGPTQTRSASGGKTSSTSLPATTSIETLVGGGGAAPTTTPGQSPTTPTGAVKTGGVDGWRSADAIRFSGMMLGLVTLCLI
ncbi:hypothetical protein L207DRAFT_636087 [Hyaloscypha variabilis F]|uniref:Uncharacterized protein n=1 Tax=Hyaloscypha variabilis (strain UAMH 11265 / GT02V1 / F) TaxID=1149755 RepID=A0A2J6RFT6_HYAVF|nr:hypothetical protein L207DRAFT_636087 [Hyaloscypha variabilis F]